MRPEWLLAARVAQFMRTASRAARNSQLATRSSQAPRAPAHTVGQCSEAPGGRAFSEVGTGPLGSALLTCYACYRPLAGPRQGGTVEPPYKFAI